jgi:cytochrome c-type biogenesis protein CcmE
MTPRQKRLWTLIAVLGGLAVAAAVAFKAFDRNLQYFYNPSEVAAGTAPSGKSIRVGGMVSKGSVIRTPGSLEVQFTITDFAKDVTVKYTGLLPDLFREGQGIIAHGELQNGVFMADEVLAKHDEKYMPPEVAKSLKQQHAAAAPAPTDTTAPAPEANR